MKIESFGHDVTHEHIAACVQEAIEDTAAALRYAEGYDDDPGLYHRLAAVLETLRDILAEAERSRP